MATYVVSVKLTADDKEVREAISELTGKAAASASSTAKQAVDGVRMYRDAFQQLGSAVSGFQQQWRFLSGTYRAVSSTLGIGVKDLVFGAVSVNQDLETLQTGLAAVLSTIDSAGGGPFAHFKDAQKEVLRLMPIMRKDAASTGASFEDIAQAFTTVLPFARDLTDNLETLEKLAANSTFWDTVTGRRGATALDVRQVLSGQLNPRIIQNAALNKDLTELKRLYSEMAALPAGPKQNAARQRLFERIVQDLKPSAEAQTAISKSFSGMKYALEGELKALFQEGTSPIWMQLKGVLSELNEWVRTPEGMAKIKEYARDFAEFVKGAATFLYKAFRFFYDNFDTVKNVFIAFVRVWSFVNVIRFIGGIEAFVGAIASGTFSDFVRALMGFRSAGAAGAAAGAAGAGTAAGEGAAARGAVAATTTAAVVARVATGAVAGAFFLTPDDHQMTPEESAQQAPRLQQRALAAGIQNLPKEIFSDPEVFGRWNRITADFEKVGAAVAEATGVKKIYAPLYLPSGSVPGFNQMGDPTKGPGVTKNLIVLEIRDGKATVVSIEKGKETDIQVGTKTVGQGGDL